ncbi:microtubule-associated protein RP/EB family member 2 [Drosophila mojavensis]|uniref:Calponin-homology (CH) domain-containing protein n=1 Tax=Drosophila mojavensis TaxID=7230 RepID=B4KK35_DROMO|nr:microtubule-associated protein RP/EB family member 2 [Drosophila mojavensis]EDW11553.1 uncharacterized protein Dmoj_GI14128 [Drosophila mojavensis]
MALNRRLINVISTNNTKTTWSRQSILSWCNQFLSTDIPKIDDLCTGAAYCCLMDMLVPDCINLNKVKFKCYLENHYINNLALLQQCFNKLKINKSIPIHKLVRGKFQDNYEFAVWFRLFFEANFHKLPEGYDAMVRRNYQTFTKELKSSMQKVQRADTTVAITPKGTRERAHSRDPTMTEQTVRVAPITGIARARAIGGQSTNLNRC